MVMVIMDATTTTTNTAAAALLLPSSLLLAGFCSLVLYLYSVLWRRPARLLESLRRQGIKGPPCYFPLGSLLEMRRIASAAKAGRGGGSSTTQSYDSALFPYFDRWRKDYGPVYVYSTGSLPMLYVSDPDLVKEMSLCVSLDLGKATHLQKAQEPLFGHGIIKSNGAAWAHQRKIISPEFFMDKVKGMVDLIVESAVPLLNSWESRIECGGGTADIVVDQDLRNFSADVISRACFGSNYNKGKEIFLRLRALQKAMSKPSLFFKIHQLRFLPTKSNREIRRLVREIRSLILNVVKERKMMPAALFEKDLLQSILESANSSGGGPDTADHFIVDNCKTIYFAGHDTSSVTAAWCLMLLASHREWQARVRAEVMEVCGGKLPDSDMLQKMKTLTTVIQETLRLYPPSPFVSRETFRDMKFGDLLVPRGVNIWIPTATMHHDPRIWGPDAHEFKPERFANGVHGACKFPQAYIPFGLGARKCVGRNLAMVELKIVLSLILSRFSFSLSPEYRHSPALRLTIGPEFGVRLVVCEHGLSCPDGRS